MEIVYVYERPRSDFGRHCAFEDSDLTVLCDISVDHEKKHEYLVHTPRSVSVQCAPERSEHSTNTQSLALREQGMNHLEGGWPKNVDISDPQSKRIHIKSLLQEKSYKQALTRLCEPTERFIRQNIALDIYESYFDPESENQRSKVSTTTGMASEDGMNGVSTVSDQLNSVDSTSAGRPATTGASKPTLSVDEFLSPFQNSKPEAKMVSVFKDPQDIKRSACHLSWLPGDGSKIAVAFCSTKFSQTSVMNQDMNFSFDSYIWDVSNPSRPEVALSPQSPLCCLEFNPKDTNLIVGGSFNGVVNLFDVRTEDRGPVEESDIKLSHKDAIYDVRWIQSKNSTMFLTVSTDGVVNLWDTRQMSKPTETLEMYLTEKNGVPPPYKGILGGFSLHYNASHSASKYMVGTEQGMIIACTRRKNKPTLIDRAYVGHHGPVYSVMRNPFLTKYFLSIGDWSAKIWEEETETPIISTRYHNCYLTSGCWSTSRPGVFFTTRADGNLDIWDLFHHQSHPTLSVPVSQQALHTIRLFSGQLLAVGGEDGNVTMIKLSSSLSGFRGEERHVNSQETEAMREMFERETKREQHLAFRRKQLAHEKNTSQKEKGERPSHVELESFDQEFENKISASDEQVAETDNTGDENNDTTEELGTSDNAEKEESGANQEMERDEQGEIDETSVANDEPKEKTDNQEKPTDDQDDQQNGNSKENETENEEQPNEDRKENESKEKTDNEEKPADQEPKDVSNADQKEEPQDETNQQDVLEEESVQDEPVNDQEGTEQAASGEETKENVDANGQPTDAPQTSEAPKDENQSKVTGDEIPEEVKEEKKE